MTNRSIARGFTLLEILVAIAVFAIFSTMAYGGLMQLLSNRERIDAERAFWRNISLAFVRIEQDLSLARERPVRGIDGSLQPAFEGRQPDPRALAEPSIEFTRGGILVPNGFTADLQHVSYQLLEGKLMRITWPVLDRAPTSKPSRAAILNNVEKLEVKFTVDGNGWSDVWPPLGAQPSATASRLPRAVKIIITLKERGKYERTFLVGDSLPPMPTTPSTAPPPSGTS